MLETAAGFRPALRDNLPAIGPSKIPGLLTAIGHYRHGIMLAPITAMAILELLQSNRVPELVKQFSARRFEDEKQL
jgi:glycine oxidase